MNIAVLGTGMVGRAIGARAAELGHAVALGTRDPATTLTRTDDTGRTPADWLGEHPGITLATFADAAAGADLIVHASGGSVALATLELAGADNLAGTVVLDVSNPLDFSAGMPPTLFVKDTDSLAEQIQRAHPRARVVKSLNTLNADLMVHPAQLPQGTTVFVSGNDTAAKATVTELLTSFGHTDVIDLGDLSTARGTEMFLPLWLRLWGALGTATFNVKVVR